jgi:hypothetical protein
MPKQHFLKNIPYTGLEILTAVHAKCSMPRASGKQNQHESGSIKNSLLEACFMSSTINIQVLRSFETSADF